MSRLFRGRRAMRRLLTAYGREHGYPKASWTCPHHTGIVEETLAACSVAVLLYLSYFALLAVSSRRQICQYVSEKTDLPSE
jgi:hypothetical protein